jgi:hypothetical protein
MDLKETGYENVDWIYQDHFEHGNEQLGSTWGREFIGYLSDN